MALCVKENEKLFDSRILCYMEEGKSAVVKKLLEESSDSFCNLVDSSGSTLLHYAAKFSNVKVLDFLIKSRLEIDAKDNDGCTPLMLAVRTGHRKTIAKLLEAKARIVVKNNVGENALRMFFRWLNGSPHTAQELYKIAKPFLLRLDEECSNNSLVIAHRLLDAGCPLNCAVILKNDLVTATMMLSRRVCRFELMDALCMAVSTADLPNAKLLMDNGAVAACGSDNPLAWYPKKGKDTPHKLELLKILMSRCNYDDEDSQGKKFYMLAECSREVVRILLKYVDLREEVMPNGLGALKTTYLHGLMSNPNPDIINELPVGVNFDFDRLDTFGDNCLPKAVLGCNLSTVEFLLGKGVRVNNINTYGCNVLMRACLLNDKHLKTMLKIIHILLKHGADVQYTQEFTYKTLLDFAEPWNLALIKPIIAYLAMLESLGKPVIQLIHDQIESHIMFKSHFKLCKLRLERMKRITVHKSVTLYKLLTESDKKVMLYIQNPEFPDRFNCLMHGRRRSNAYYDFLLRRRTFECIRAAQLKREAAVALTEILQVDNHTVTDLVLDYLNTDDWKSLRDIH